MLNVPLLKSMNIDHILTSCQLIQESDCVIFNAISNNPCMEKEVLYRAFTPFSVDITAKTNDMNRYIGGLDGFICEYRPNYGTPDKPITFEDIAAEYEDTDVADFAISIFDRNGKLPCQWSTGRDWCGERHFFTLVTRVNIHEEYQGIGLEPFLVENLHKIIQYDCCIQIDSVFIPVAALAHETKTALRRVGFTRIGGSDNGYLVKHSQLNLLRSNLSSRSALQHL